MKKHLPFLIIVIALFLGIISPYLLSEGMFFDGVLYALISNNLARGIGSFWELHGSNMYIYQFNEHPPLAFGLQSIFFRVLGNSIIVERIYSLTTFIVTGIIIMKIWKRISEPALAVLAWLPLLFWIVIPLVSWSASNNILENTMMIFDSLAILYVLKSKEKKRILNISLAGFMLFLGVLSKGLVALFPLSIFFWFLITDSKIKFKSFVINTFILSLATILPLLIVFLISPQSIDTLYMYFSNQIIGSINNIQTVNSRFFIVIKLFKEIIPVLLLVIIAFVLTRKEKLLPDKRMIYCCFLLGLSGVVPIMISMKQSGFYILATFPFFSIAFALLVARRVLFLTDKISIKSIGFRIYKIFSFIILLVSFVLVLLSINKVNRDEEKIADIKSVIEVVQEETTISVQPILWQDWSLQSYFYRYANISIDAQKQFTHKYVLVSKGYNDKALVKYDKIAIELSLFDLYSQK